jgi:hypothetical protein
MTGVDSAVQLLSDVSKAGNSGVDRGGTAGVAAISEKANIANMAELSADREAHLET